MSRKRFPANPAAARLRGRRARDPLPHLGAPGHWWVAALPSKAPWENSFGVGRVMSAGNLEHSAVGVAGRGDLIRALLLQRDGDMGGGG